MSNAEFKITISNSAVLISLAVNSGSSGNFRNSTFGSKPSGLDLMIENPANCSLRSVFTR